MGLVRENGAGKSTTIKLIMNAIQKSSGSVKIMGVDNTDPAFSDLKQDIEVVLDEAYYPEVLTAKRLNTVMRHTYRNWDEGRYFSYFIYLALPQDKEFKDLSRGMKMKLAIAVAMSHKPKLLILDEATSGLDPMVRDEILDMFSTSPETRSIPYSYPLTSSATLKKYATTSHLFTAGVFSSARKRTDCWRNTPF